MGHHQIIKIYVPVVALAKGPKFLMAAKFEHLKTRISFEVLQKIQAKKYLKDVIHLKRFTTSRVRWTNCGVVLHHFCFTATLLRRLHAALQ